MECDFTPAGKYRNGAARWWCRTHQAYWGVKADLAAFDPAREKVCGKHADPLDVLLDPLVLDMGIAGVFASSEIAQVNVTPPAVIAFKHAHGCLDCARCGYPHLDLGAFAVREHRRHYCGNCGNDSTHSKTPIVSNPLFALSEFYTGRLTFE